MGMPRLTCFHQSATGCTVLSPRNTRPDKVDALIVLDRKVDMITPLLTQLTYEGLIDELVGIKNCEYSRSLGCMS